MRTVDSSEPAAVGDGVRAVARALRLLALLSQHEVLSLAELQQALDLPKSTVHRLLATLCHEGYAAADARPGFYRVAAKAQMLGGGYSRRSRLVDAGGPVLRRVTREIRWPLAIGTLEGTVVVVRESTMPYSPLAVQASTVGHRHRLDASAMGLAYLAFCDEAQRDILRQALLSGERLQVPVGRSGTGCEPDGTHMSATAAGTLKPAPGWQTPAESQLAQAIELARQRGYGLRLPARSGDSATIAVPIGEGMALEGVLSMTTFGALMTHQTLARHLPVLRCTAAEILAAMG